MAWLWVASLAVICFATGTATHWALLQHLGYALAGMDGLAWSMVGAGRRGLVVSHSVDRARVTAGDEITESYVLRRNGWWTVLRVEIDSAGGEDGERVGLTLPTRRTLHVSRRRRLSHRGRWQLGAGTVIISDPFGLVRLPVGQVDPSTFIVYPRPIVVAPEVLVGGTRHPRQRSPLPEPDASLGNLRPYQVGDSPSRIHWRSTARSGTLLVAEPEVEQHHIAWLLVDLGGGEERAERAAGMAAFLAARLADAGEAVGAIVAGAEQVIVTPRRGRDRPEGVLEHLATVKASAEPQVERLVRTAARHGGGGDVLFLITPAVVAAAVRQLSRVAAVVVVPGVALPEGEQNP